MMRLFPTRSESSIEAQSKYTQDRIAEISRFVKLFVEYHSNGVVRCWKDCRL